MKILVRLPNWLGDMVMAAGFLHGLRLAYPGAAVSVVVKKGLDGLLPFFPPFEHTFVFSKEDHKGVLGAWRFGRKIRHAARFDVFFCLPDSLSSAVMARATGAQFRIGFKKEGRNFLLTHAPGKPGGRHRAEEYLALLESYTGQAAGRPVVALQHGYPKEGAVVVNINSEAASRRLTVAKATELLNNLCAATDRAIILVGAPKEAPFVASVVRQLADPGRVKNRAGTTSLPQLAQVLASASLVLTTDSGPAHLSNALGTHTVVLFGAGNENNTAPYGTGHRTIIRLNRLSCEPCLKNVCVRYGLPQCLEQLNSSLIVEQALRHLNTQHK